jgi:hypothetical protein
METPRLANARTEPATLAPYPSHVHHTTKFHHSAKEWMRAVLNLSQQITKITGTDAKARVGRPLQKSGFSRLTCRSLRTATLMDCLVTACAYTKLRRTVFFSAPEILRSVTPLICGIHPIHLPPLSFSFPLDHWTLALPVRLPSPSFPGQMDVPRLGDPTSSLLSKSA